MTNDEHLAVGSRIRMADDDASPGEIVEDFGELAGADVSFDGHTVRGRRWAVRLDDGRLLFADDDQLETVES